MAWEPHDRGAGPAAGGGHLRAADTDREQVINELKAAFVEGRLSRSELVRRTGQALESRTYAELAGASAGIPARRVSTVPPRQPAAAVHARRVSWKVVTLVVSMIIVLPGLGVAFFATQYGSLYIMLSLWCVAAGLSGAPRPPWHGRQSVH